jgi:hypothetical protein
MRFDRLAIAVPVLVGALGVGSAYGHVLIDSQQSSVRDTVYPTCAHNGVHFNKQGHANCGLHKGWSRTGQDTPPAPPSSDVPTGSGGSGEPATPPHPSHPSLPSHPSHPAHPAHPSHPTRPNTAAATSHGGGHGHSQSHGHGHGHGSGGGHGKSGHGG